MNNCPNCGESLEGGLIFDTFLEQHNGNRELALRDVSMYGATETEGRWGLELGIYDIEQDMTIGYKCPHCHATWDRFTGKIYE